MPHESQVFLLGITMIMIQVGTTKPSVEDSWPLVDLAVRIQKEIRDCALNQYLRCFVGSLMMCVVWPDIHVPQSRMQMVKEIIETSVKACSNPDELSAEIAVQQLVLSASLMMSGFGLSMDFVLKTFEAIGKRVDHKHRVTTEAATLIRQSLAHVLFIKAVSILTKQPVSSVNRVSGGMSYHMLQFFDDATRQEALVRWAAEGTPETASCYHILQALLRLYDPSVPSIGRLDAIDPQAHADLLALRLMFTHNRNEVLSERAVIKECELSSLSLCVLAAMALNPDVHGLVSYADFRLSNVLVRRLLGSLSIEIAQEDRLKAIARKGNLDGWSFLAPASGRVGVMLYFSEPLLQHMLDTNQPEYVTHLYATLCPIFRKHVPFSCVRYRWEVRCALWLLCRELSTHVPESEPPPQEKSTIARAGTMLVRRPKKEKKVHVLNSEETVVIERAVAYCYSLQVYKLKTPYLRLVEHFLNVSKAYRTSGGLPHQDLIVIDPDAVVVLEDSFEEPQALTNDNVKLESKAVRFLFQPTSKQFHKLEPTKVMKGVQDLCKLSTEQLEERYQQTRDSVDLRRLLLGWHLVHKVEDQPRLFVLLALQVANLAAYLAYLVTAKKRCPETETSLAELKALEEVLIRKAECVGHPIDQVTPEGDEAQDLLKTLSMTFPQEPKQCKAEILLRISESPDGVVVRRIFPTYMLSVPVPECSLVTSVTSIYQANVSSILSAREVEKSADKKECVQKWWAARQGLEEDVNNYLKSSPSLQLILKVLSSPCHTLAEDMNKSVLELLKCQEKLMDPQFRRRVAPWTLLLVMIVSNENWEECISTGKTTRFTTPKVSDLSIHSSLFKSVIGMYCLAGLALTSQTTKPVKPSELFFASIKSMLADCGRQAVVNMNNAPVLLLLDGTLGRVPWENTWALKDRDVYRLCSLKHFARSKEPLKDTRKNRWFYVVDPLNNLPSAQEAFAAAGDIRKQWRGSCGEEIPRRCRLDY
ncbi:MAG: uncharacterized protein KVP18_003344 [Porospora cf. gigantea A]|uniref:uncharacterized protein n=1 Tax=Porospora cf. gigantea A TaxID=2853593 RepID=UPI00355AB9C3|nr:MAG: hypothetical protein KVP18_003344 [Porospora cf. gigantea A]